MDRKEDTMNVGWLRACVANLENEKNVTSIMRHFKIDETFTCE